jgi:uncharacterized protein UPF0029/RWD domain-containing protein
MENALEDELTSINSIYEKNTLELVDVKGRICTLHLPSYTSVVLRVEFPGDYPESPPSILGTESVGEDAPKGTGKGIVNLARDVISNLHRPGEPCIFDLVEGLNTILQDESPIRQMDEEPELVQATPAETEHIQDIESEPPWTVSQPITEKKSVFVSRAAEVASPEQAKNYLQHLLVTDRKVARATHNITAWRIRGPDGTSYQDCDDDGEDAAGGRLLHLMQLMDVWNVMIVVTRWYGGIRLGPDRFRIINNSAREALITGGFAQGGKKLRSGS